MKITAVFLLAWLSMFSSYAAAETQTGRLSGQEIVGHTKTCYYNVLGSIHTTTIANLEICPASLEIEMPLQGENDAAETEEGGTAFKTGEKLAGMTKICFYVHMGSQYTKTVSNTTLCPLTLTVSP